MPNTSHSLARTILVISATITAAIAPQALPAEAVEQPPFSCQPGFYQVIAGQLAELSPGTSMYDSLGPDYSNYNAMGYRIADGYLYGISGTTLHRIDANGTLTDLAELDITSGSYTGDFGDDGLLHISRGGSNWYTIDVDTFAVNRIPELSEFKAVADITNVHGTFYGVSSDGILYLYDPAARTVTAGGHVAGLPTTAKPYGAAWSTAGGNLYIGRNSGQIYQITGYSTGTPTATQVGSAPPTNSNDGASCSLAPVPAGLNDVDGPIPETDPSTPEAQAAASAYLAAFAEISETLVEFDPINPSDEEPLSGEPPTVVVSEAEPEPVENADIGQGASCESTVDYDRAERAAVQQVASVDSPTTLFQSDFVGEQILSFTILSGNWNMHDGRFNQLNTCGFDYSALLDSYPVESFRWQATFSGRSGDNQGGLLLNQSAVDTRSGAMLVDLTDGGGTLRWGTYDVAGYYQYIGSVAVAKPGPGGSVTLAAEVLGPQVSIFFNGALVAETTAVNIGGYVGLVASKADIAFDEAILTALPAA